MPKLVTRLHSYHTVQCTVCMLVLDRTFNSVDEVKRAFAHHLRDSPACETARAEAQFVRGGMVKWR